MEIEKIDKSNMRQTILDFPKQFQLGLEIAKNVKTSGKFDGIVIASMGGSALPADILNIWMNKYKSKLPLYIHHDYGLPDYINNKHLVICISYSGNTEETLSAFEQARKKKLKIIAITSGGKLVELCKKYRIPYAKIPAGFQPRMALGFQFAALIKVLVKSGLIRDNLKDLSGLEKILKPNSFEIQGQKLAKKLKGRIPVIYSSNRLNSLSRIWKINLNENSKIPAFNNCFPELNHNEIIGFTNPQKKFHLILLQDPTDHPRILKRMKLTTNLIKKKVAGIDIINIKGKDILSKIFSNILLANWTSYWLALEHKIDPTPIKMIEEFKKKL